MPNQFKPSPDKRSASRLLLLMVAILSLWLLAACGGEESDVNPSDTIATSSASLSSLSEQIGALQTDASEAPAAGEATAEEPSEPEATSTHEPTVAPTAFPSPTAAPSANTPRPTSMPTTAPTRAATAVPARINGLPTILEIDLPPEAWDTLDLIDSNGPFPFDRDGITFQNREGLLPSERRGYYSEYTVITPGERTRGARRIIAGEGGEFYYTDDHYDSFHYIVRPER